jgi:hypothetical protein
MPEDRLTISAEEAAALLGISKPTLLRRGTGARRIGTGPYGSTGTRWRRSANNTKARRRFEYRLPGFCLPTSIPGEPGGS